MPTCCRHQYLCMTYTNILGFLLNFITWLTSWVNEQWPKKSHCQNKLINVMICDSGAKGGWNIFESLKSWYMTYSIKDTQSLICFPFLVNQSWAYAVSSQSWTFKTDLTQKLHFYTVSWHKQSSNNQTIQFWLRESMQFKKLWPKR